MVTEELIKQIESVNTLDDLRGLHIGEVQVDISHRGGYIAFHSIDISTLLKIDPVYLPRKYGAYCNYLGGGVRGAIIKTNHGITEPEQAVKVLGLIADACVRVYMNIEEEEGSSGNDDKESDDINWDNMATKAARDAGIESAY